MEFHGGGRSRRSRFIKHVLGKGPDSIGEKLENTFEAALEAAFKTTYMIVIRIREPLQGTL